MRNFVCVCLLAISSSVTAAEPFTAEHLVRIDRVGSPVVSPSGDKVVYAVRHADIEADRGRYDLWLSDIGG
jgi:dipeptidyl aminopeptidase/acylaminoacyl peptidase